MITLTFIPPLIGPSLGWRHTSYWVSWSMSAWISGFIFLLLFYPCFLISFQVNFHTYHFCLLVPQLCIIRPSWLIDKCQYCHSNFCNQINQTAMKYIIWNNSPWCLVLSWAYIFIYIFPDISHNLQAMYYYIKSSIRVIYHEQREKKSSNHPGFYSPISTQGLQLNILIIVALFR